METREWTFHDRKMWGSGEWDDEPDKMQWTDEATGFPCLIVRNRMGAWCGYVGVSEGHPWYKISYNDVEPHPNVHGGLTFASVCSGNEEGVCHEVEEGEDDEVWWLGFDCAHYQDHIPQMAKLLSRGGNASYKDIAYVRNEVAELAQQAAEVVRGK